ncbi:hypothetical protein GCM10011320_43730 [Neoroseomonas lacus]|uniref:Uncharacterized protein n=1 Tax=Neoroseomonas lacus TaxID=287609 RepID=A0A917KX60_9PROT|nr:hypothetical protein GCM10011320_43730 [Neoroseomonas lacus]
MRVAVMAAVPVEYPWRGDTALRYLIGIGSSGRGSAVTHRIEEIEGIEKVHGEKLRASGIEGGERRQAGGYRRPGRVERHHGQAAAGRRREAFQSRAP